VVGGLAVLAVVTTATVLTPNVGETKTDIVNAVHVPGWGNINLAPGPEEPCLTATLRTSAGLSKVKAAGKWTAEKTGENVFDFAQDEAMGWALKKILNEKDETPDRLDNINKSLEKTNEAVKELQEDMVDLKKQMTDLQQTMGDEFNGAKADSRLTALTNAEADLKTYQDYYTQLILDKQNRAGGGLDADDAHRLVLMRDGLPRVMNDIITQMKGSGAGQEPLPTLWNRQVWRQLGHATGEPPTDVYSAEFVDQASLLTNYYATLLADALRLDAEVNRVEFTYSNDTYKPQPGHVCADLQTVAQGINQFTNWSTNGVGPIPDATVVDLRDDKSLLWSETSIRPVGGHSDSYYCGDEDGYCYVKQYAGLDGGGMKVTSPRDNLVNTWAVRDHKLVNGKLSTLGGWADWRVPTTADINNLQAGTMTGGLSAWAAANSTTIFRPEEVVVQGNGKHQGTKVGVITPILVDPTAPGTGDKVFDLYTAMPTDTKLSKVTKAAGDGSQAGRLFVVRDFVKETADGGGMPEADSAPAQAADPRPAKLADFDTAGKPTTFTTPSVCQAAANQYLVPDGVTALRVSARGGSGATGRTMQSADNSPPVGGRGAQVDAIVPVIPGSTVYVQVGGNGTSWNAGGTGGVGGGGEGGANTDYGEHGSGGGGMSGISTDPDCSQWLLVAAGGGGSGDGGASGKQGQANGGRGGEADFQAANAAAGNGENEYSGKGPSTYAQGTEPCTTTAGGAFPNLGGGNPGIGYAGDRCGRWGGDGTWFAGGKGGDAVRTASAKGGFPGSAGGGGGAGFWSGGGGGASNHYAGSGAGGSGGVSYVTTPDVWGIAPSTVKIALSDAAPAVTVTPLSGTPSTLVTLTTSADTLRPDQSPTLTATTRGDAEGTITFYDDQQPGKDQSIGAAPIVDGKAELTKLTKALTLGTHDISASYGGFGPYGPGEANHVTVTITRPQPPMQIGLSASTVRSGTNPKVTVTLPKGVTGNVDVFDWGLPGPDYWVGTADLDGNGTAVLETFNKTMSPGAHRVTASYNGDANYYPNDSDSVILTVT
jgi:hypothetical protein